MIIEDVYPLSPMQEGLYYHWLSAPGSYFEQLNYHIKGELDIKTLEKSYQLLVARHAVLRTCFTQDFGQELLQVVQKQVPSAFQYIDVSQEEDFSVERFKEMDRKAGFDLNKGSQMRLTVLGFGNNVYEFIWSHHHILMDGWCISILVRDFSEIYRSIVQRRAPRLPKVYPYSNYIKWVSAVDKERSLKYWADYLSGYDTVSSLPRLTQNTRTDYLVKRMAFSLPDDVRTSLRTLCEETGITENTFLQAAWGVLLARYNNTDDVLFGGVVSGRPPEIPGVEEMIGLFINTIPVRITARQGMTVSDLLKEVHRTSIQGIPHHYTQLSKIQSKSELGRGLFDHVMIFENFPVQEMVEQGIEGQGGGQELSILSCTTFDQTNYDFTIMGDPGTRFQIVFNYNGNVYDEAYMTRMQEHLLALIGQMLENPSASIERLDYLSSEEKRQLLQDFHGRKLEYDKASTFPGLFAAQVQRVPDQVALSFENVSLTYKELDEKANQLANYLLQEYSLQPDDLVGIMVDRSEKMILALLAVQKAGAAYVPIEPDYPDSRKEFIITDTGIKVLLTQSDYMFDVGYFQGGVFALDIQLDLLETPSSAPEVKVLPEHLAYVIYTSGSTGNPKGVLVEHRNLMHSTAPRLSVYSGVESFLLLSSIAFDSSVAGVFGTLAAGGRLCITRKIDVGNVATLSGYIAREQITHLLAVPSYYKLLLAELAQKENSLKQVIVAGEACPAQLVEQHHAAETLQGCELFNEYGPTEGSVWSTYHRYSKGEEFSATIGQPVPNVEVYILGSNNDLQPIGVMGEICIAGGGLARGYLNRPELTEQKFVPHPFQPGSRMYRTGDAGRWMRDGSIEFLGRRDDQVKIRGYRIELGEVENALRNYPSVDEAVVIAKANEDQVNELVAYIVSSETLTASDLQTYLEAHLPSYAVPAHFVQIEQLPLTSNGKVDKKKLPDPKGSTLASGTAYVAPRTEIEECLVAVYEEVLKRQPIGIKEDFFALGGDSIKSIQIVSRVKQRGYSLNIQDILLYPSIEDLATRVKAVTRQAEQGVITGEIPLSPIQHWFFNKNLSTPHHYNQSVLLFSGNPLSEKAIRVVFDKLVLHHDALRMVYRRTASGWVQENKGKEQGYAFEVLAYDEATFAEHCDRIQSTINLQAGPLFKVALFRGSDGDRLLMVAHHLVIDGVSWRILFEDISTLYQQYAAGIALALPAKTDPFKYWQEKQVEYASSEKTAQEEAYWSSIESLDIKPLPQDHEGGNNTLKEADSLGSLLDENLTERLLTKTSQAYRTEINDVLLTALGLALEEVFGLDKVLIEMEGHGREDIGADVDVSRTVGWFTTIYPVALDMSHKNDIIRQLIEVKETLHRIPGKGIGYGVLRYMAGKNYKLKPQVSFNYLGDFGSGIKTEKGEQLFEFPGGYQGSEVPPDMQRATLLDVSGMVVSGQLRLMIRYSREQYEAATIRRLLDCCQQRLVDLADRLAAEQRTHLTPVDLTYKDLDIDEVRDLDRKFTLEDVYPLSPLQEGLYYHWLNTPEAYFEQVSYRLTGKLDIAKIEQSYHALVSRHAMLRTCFREDFGQGLLQVVQRKVPSAFRYIDLSDQENASVEEYKEADKTRRFDLRNGSQMRLTVLGIGNDLYEFIWSHHHILMDGWCVGVLINDFYEIYHSMVQGREPGLEKIHPYSNYIKWLSSVNREKSFSYWDRYLAGYDTVSSLPRLKAREAGEFQHKEMKFSLDASVRQSMKALCEELGVTENTFMQTAWGILLGRYNNTEDVVFGTVVSGRPPEVQGVEQMIGLFINTIPVRIRMDAEKSVRESLKEAQQASIEGMGHHYTQLADIQANSQLGRDLFDHLLVFENYPVQQIVSDGMAAQKGGEEMSLLSSSSSEHNNYDFTIIVLPGETINIIFVYNGRVYDEGTMSRLQKHFSRLVQKVLEQPARRICEIGYLDEKEKNRLLLEFNNTFVDYPREKTIVELFAEQARKTPERIALSFEGSEMTYRELHEQSNRLAHYLKENHNIQPDDRVGIMLDRSDKTIVAILAVLKSGGAYVPVDVDYPAARKEYIMKETGIMALITQSEFIFDLGSYNGSVFAIDLQLETLETSIETPELSITPANLAYVMFTSGSTGNPKGVMVEHRSVVRLVKSASFVNLTGEEVLLSTGAVSFDATTFEYWSMLLNGGTLVMSRKETLLDSGLLAQEIRSRKVEMMWFTAGWLNQLVDENIEIFEGLKTLLAGGDKLSAPHIQKLRDRYPRLEIVNGYGPTENTTFSLTHNIKNVQENIPIGKPISSSTAYILDGRHQPVPVGVAGEIYVGGDGLARGYLNNAELTAQKFITVTLPLLGETRLYKTDDLGRWTEEGLVEFLGRKDAQVKIRGFRIEPGEIENVLQSHPAIDSAVVIASGSGEEKQLVAYVVGKEELNTAQMAAYLTGILPSYMVPAHFVQMESLPLNANGKVDYRKLPEPGNAGMLPGVEYIAPRNETEEKLAAIWQDVLRREKISVKDDFFDLGGHSLKITRLASQIHKEFNVRLELKELFEVTVLEDLAQLIGQSSKTSFATIEPVEPQESYAISSSQRRLWVLSQFEDANIAYNMTGVYVFRGNLDKDAFEAAFASLIGRHEILRTTFRENRDGEVRQYIHLPEASGFNLRYLDLRSEEGRELAVHDLVQKDLVKPFDLSAGPLLRASLYQMEDGRWVFSYVMHHIISDGWSMGILIKELLEFYNAHANGTTALQEPLRIQYKDYAAWQQQQLSGENLKAHKEYWLEQFEGELPVLELPAGKPRPAVKTYNGREISVSLNAELSQGLREFSQRQGGTLFMGILAAVTTLMHRYTGQEDIIIGSPIAGRMHADLEDQIGFYVNTLALRSRFSGEQNFQQLLEQVKQVTLDAYEHQVYPFDELVEGLNLHRDMSRNPLFDVVVALQNNETNAMRNLGELEISGFGGARTVVSKFDLSFEFKEAGEELNLLLGYNSDIYDPPTIDRMARHLEQLLSAIIHEPQKPIRQLDYLKEGEKKLLTVGFNDTGADYPRDKNIVQLFEEQVGQTPDRTALVFEETTLTYKELNEQSNRLAHFLKSRFGLCADELVGLHLERGHKFMVAVLGILKAGAAYLPLDAEFPQERIAALMQDSGSKVLLNEQLMQEFLAEANNHSGGNPASSLLPSSLAYVMYTSGSTGKPKGVMAEHRAVIRLVKNTNYVNLRGEEVILSAGAVSFDATTFEYWAPLLNGGQLVMTRKEVLLDSSLLAQELHRRKVDIMFFTTGWVNQLIDEEIEVFKGLKTLLTGGEKISIPHMQKLHDRYPKLNIVHCYGPTENTTFSLTYPITSIQENIPIGSAISNSTAYILDAQHQLVPVGVAGEICVGGDGLARGYLNNPGLTAEKFITADIPVVGETRLYKSGDLGRWTEDGNIEFIGRRDGQVKIRGFRIEPGEIEAALLGYDKIVSTVVTARVNVSGEKELVAYVTGNEELDVFAIRAYLGSILPAYMIPVHFVQMDEFPLTSSGKVDRKKLPEPEGAGQLSAEYVAPRNEIEEKLALIWQEVLGRERIGVKDNFFELGGHSLKITRLASRIKKDFEVNLGMRTLFSNPTIEAVAGEIKKIYWASNEFTEIEDGERFTI
jgi:amino acid adenylation domain-containing protein/non-ribosomal peptide synthase protein (TIGR01720 family)